MQQNSINNSNGTVSTGALLTKQYYKNYRQRLTMLMFFYCMFFSCILLHFKKHVSNVFYLLINVFIIYGIYFVRSVTFSVFARMLTANVVT